MYVYLIINDANGKYYVGKTVSRDLQSYLRWKMTDAQRRPDLRIPLYAALRKYPAHNWRIHPLMSTLSSNEDICRWEVELIQLFRCQDPQVGYNVADGGEGGNCGGGAPLGNKNVLGKHWSWKPETPRLSGDRNPFFGKKHTSETKQKLSAARLGKKNPHSEEHRRNLAEANRRTASLRAIKIKQHYMQQKERG